MTINRRPVALSEEAFLNAVRSRAEMAFQTTDANLAAERMEVLEHYQGNLPDKFHPGSSGYVSRDVWDAVEAYTSNLQEAFAAGNNIVAFAPVGQGDVSLAAMATAYVEHVLFRQNDGFEIFGDVIKDGAMGRTGFVKVYWERAFEPEYLKFDGPRELLEAALSQDGVEIEEKPQDYPAPEGLFTKATLRRMVEVSQVRVEPVPPEEMSVIGRTRNIRKLPFIGQRTVKTLGDLVAAGYDPAKVYAINENGHALEFNEEAQRRNQETLPDAFLGLNDAADEAGRLVVVHESYMRIDRDGDGYQSLWMVVHSGGVILHDQKVARHPFVAFNPLPMPHRFHGENFAASVIPMANVKTTMVRGITDNLVAATNPKVLVQEGALKDPRQLIASRLGKGASLVFVNHKGNLADAVSPMPQNPINPYVPQIIEQMDVAKEATTGNTRLAQGLNKDALSNQNASVMVNDQIGVSQIRTKVAARRFAVQCLKELVLLIYEIAIENASQQEILEIAGEFVEITPSQWRSRKHVNVSMHLGYGEREKTAEELFMFDKIMTGSPNRLYGESQRYQVLKKALETKGHKDIQNFLVDPKTLPPEQPDPKAMADVEKLKVETQGLTVDQQIKQLKVQHDHQMAGLEFAHKQQMDRLSNALKGREADRKDRETENRIDIGLAEVELNTATFADPTAERKVSAINSPNG